MPETRIGPKKNGPLIVQGCEQLVSGADGSAYAVRDTIALCRCGSSAKKPFCDGSHARAGFTDEKDPDRLPDARDDYAGDAVTVHDNRGICSHAGYCTDGLPAVWRQHTEPWIDPNAASAADVIETIKKCPSGALAWTAQGEEHASWNAERRILVMPGGPYAIQGGADLAGVEWGAGASREHFTLCRCGKSKNKPFCNGAHWYHDFDDERQAVEGEDAWHDVGAFADLTSTPVQEVVAGGVKVALIHADGALSALSGTCAHAGGPLGHGTLADGTVTCPWHGWRFDARTGQDPDGKGAVGVHPVEVRDGRVFVNARAVGGGPTRRTHRLARDIAREPGPLRVVGISTTNMSADQPRYSTSEALLQTALEHAATTLGAETRLLPLRDLTFRNCEGYYSRSAASCTWPCTITQLDPADQMEQVYEALVFWADVVLVATPIRWGNASALFYKMAERLNCVQNQVTIADRVLIRNKVAAFIITGGQDNIQAVAGQQLTFFAELGFHFPQFPFIAHSRGWSAEDMERNVEYVQQSEALHAGARELVERSLVLARTIVDAGAGAATTCRAGRKANPATRA
jgi:CDGSH-type Zn-finger protein/multimeric flavodoxin WrbA